MVQTATPYASVFSANGVNLDAVNAAIQALQAAVNADASAQRVSKGATQGIVAQLQAGRQITQKALRASADLSICRFYAHHARMLPTSAASTKTVHGTNPSSTTGA